MVCGRLRVAGEGLGFKGLKRPGAALDRGVGLRPTGCPEVVTAVDLGQPRTEALQVGFGFLDFLVSCTIPVTLAAEFVEKGGDSFEHFAVLAVACGLKLGYEPRFLVSVVEGDPQNLGGAAVGPYTIDEPADLALDVGMRREQADRIVEIQRAKRAQLAPDRNPQRISGTRTGCRHQQPRRSMTVLLVRHYVTSVTHAGYNLYRTTAAWRAHEHHPTELAPRSIRGGSVGVTELSRARLPAVAG